MVLQSWVPPPTTSTNDLSWADILTVDLSLYNDPQKRLKLIETVSTALRRDGFFYVINHGIPYAEVLEQFSLGQLAFDGVPREEKEQHKAAIAEKGSFRGYKLQNYWEIENGVRDRIEHYNFYLNEFDPPESHPTALRPYLPSIKAFYQASRTLVLKHILSLIDHVLELPEGFLWDYHEKNGETGNDLLRYMLYDPLSSSDADKTGGVYLKGHTDFNTVSILFSQPITALQILTPDGTWKWVRHRENAIVINIGDQLSFLTGGLLRATIHRVVRPPSDQAHLRRLGLFHFAHARDGIPLAPLSEYSARVREEGKNIFNDKVPTTDEWESARVKSYGTSELVKGEKWDTEVVNGIEVRHYK